MTRTAWVAGLSLGLSLGLAGCAAVGPEVPAAHEQLLARTLVSGEPIAEAGGWFRASDGNRAWLANVRGGSALELVGVDDSGQPWVGSPSEGVPSARWGSPTIFARHYGWLEDPSAPHLSLADVTGDGRADLVGIAFDGTIWVSRALEGTGFCAAARVAPTSAPFPRASFFASAFPRVSFVDLEGDGAMDIVGVSRTGLVSVVRATPDWATSCTPPTLSLVALHLDGPREVAGQTRPSFVWARRSSGTAWLVWPDASGQLWALDALSPDDRRSVGKFAWLAEPGLFAGRFDRLVAADIDGDWSDEVIAVGVSPLAASGGIDGVTPEAPLGPPIRVLSLAPEGARASIAQHAACFTSPLVDLRVGDVGGDGTPDLVGLDATGAVQVCESYVERASAGASPGHASRRLALRAALPWAPRVDLQHTRVDARDRLVLAPLRGWGAAAELVLVDPRGDGVVQAAEASGPRIVDVSHYWDEGAWRVSLRASMPLAPSWAAGCHIRVSGGALREATVSGSWLDATLVPHGDAPMTMSLVEGDCSDAVDTNGNGRLDPEGRTVWLARGSRTYAATTRVSMLPLNYESLPGGGGWEVRRASTPRAPTTTVLPDAMEEPPEIGVIVVAIASDRVDAPHELFAIASLDAIAVNASELVLALERTYGIAPDHVVVAATHAHSTFRSAAVLDSPYYDAVDLIATTTDGRSMPLARFMDEATVEAVGSALARMQPVDLRVGAVTLDRSTQEAQPGMDRRPYLATGSETTCTPRVAWCAPGAEPAGGGGCDIDPPPIGGPYSPHPYPRVSTLQWVREGTNVVVATLVSYPMHPVGLAHFRTDSLHGDYPAAVVSRLLERTCGLRADCGALFVNGAAGDIDPDTPDQTPARAAANGTLIADRALGVSFTRYAGSTLRASATRLWTRMEVPFERCAAGATSATVWDTPGTVWQLRSGSTPISVLGAMSGEPYIAHQIAFDRAWSSMPHTMFVGYANAYTGYHAEAGEHQLYGSATCMRDGALLNNTWLGPVFFQMPTCCRGEGTGACRGVAAPGDALTSLAP